MKVGRDEGRAKSQTQTGNAGASPVCLREHYPRRKNESRPGPWDHSNRSRVNPAVRKRRWRRATHILDRSVLQTLAEARLQLPDLLSKSSRHHGRSATGGGIALSGGAGEFAGA